MRASCSPAAVATAPTESHDCKRQRSDDEDVVLVLVRRLTIVFSSVCAPASVDFIVTSRGVETLAKDLGNAPMPQPRMMMLTNVTTSAHALAAGVAVHLPPWLADVSPLDVGSVVSDLWPSQPQAQPGGVLVGDVEVEEEDEEMPTGVRWMIFHSSVIASIEFRAWIPEQVKWVTQVTTFNRQKDAFVMGTRQR
jgi:hypothetical protein